MKRLVFLIITVFVSIASFGQKQWFEATSFASKSNTSYVWSDWEPSDVKILFDYTNDKITIYSPVIQTYYVVRIMDYPDDNTGTQVRFYVRNMYGYYGYVRLRIENNGNSQLYVDFSDGSIVYNVRRIE